MIRSKHADDMLLSNILRISWSRSHKIQNVMSSRSETIQRAVPSAQIYCTTTTTHLVIPVKGKGSSNGKQRHRQEHENQTEHKVSTIKTVREITNKPQY